MTYVYTRVRTYMDVKTMKKGQIVGLTLLILGFILIMLYSTIQSLQEINIANIPLGIAIGTIAMIIGAIALLLSITFEQTKDMKKRKEEIKKEEFEP